MAKVLSEDTALPPVTLKLAILLFGVIIGGVSSYFVLRFEVNAVVERVAVIEKQGSHGLQEHVMSTAAEFEKVEIEITALRGDVSAIRQLLELHMKFDYDVTPKRRAGNEQKTTPAGVREVSNGVILGTR